MDIALSLDEAKLFAAALGVLLADASLSDESWGRTVARALAKLVGADSAVLVLQSGRAVRAYGDGIAAEMLQRLALAPAAPLPPAELPPLKTRAWCRLAAAWASRAPCDDVAPDQHYSAVGLTADLELPSNAYASVACHFVTARPAAEARHLMDVLGLLLPAFTTASAARVRVAESRRSVRELIDGTSAATLLCSPDGKVLHANAALTSALAGDPDRERLHDALTRAAANFARIAAMRGRPDPDFAQTVEVRTASGSYRIRCCALPNDAPAAQTTVAVALARIQSGHGPTEMRVRFGLTARETEVAQLLASGRSNAEVAQALGISPFTARRHTERVLDKLGARSRAQVPALLGGTFRPTSFVADSSAD